MNDAGAEFFGLLVLALIGFLIGGIYGHFWDGGFSPDCWYGLIIALGGPVIIHTCH